MSALTFNVSVRFLEDSLLLFVEIVILVFPVPYNAETFNQSETLDIVHEEFDLMDSNWDEPELD